MLIKAGLLLTPSSQNSQDRYCQKNTSDGHQMSALPGVPPKFFILKANDTGASDYLMILKAAWDLRVHLLLAHISRPGKPEAPNKGTDCCLNVKCPPKAHVLKDLY